MTSPRQSELPGAQLDTTTARYNAWTKICRADLSAMAREVCLGNDRLARMLAKAAGRRAQAEFPQWAVKNGADFLKLFRPVMEAVWRDPDWPAGEPDLPFQVLRNEIADDRWLTHWIGFFDDQGKAGEDGKTMLYTHRALKEMLIARHLQLTGVNESGLTQAAIRKLSNVSDKTILELIGHMALPQRADDRVRYPVGALIAVILDRNYRRTAGRKYKRKSNTDALTGIS